MEGDKDPLIEHDEEEEEKEDDDDDDDDDDDGDDDDDDEEEVDTTKKHFQREGALAPGEDIELTTLNKEEGGGQKRQKLTKHLSLKEK